MRFSKYHGTGNDFVMIEDLDDRLRLEPGLVAALCDRHRGAGGDGVIRIAPADDADFFMDYANADGQTAEMCGNGIRCLATYVFDRGLTTRTDLAVATRAGTKRLEIEVRDGTAHRVTVDMGPPSLERRLIPMTGEPDATFVGQPLDVGGRTLTATAISMGNPHCVVFVPEEVDLGALDVPTLGRSVEVRPDFPNRTNVEFVQRAPAGGLRVRVWERGVGETMACGTGACAALVASALAGVTGQTSVLTFPGGDLEVAWRDDGGQVLLTGPAVCVFDGELDPAWLRAAGARITAEARG